MPKPFTWVSIWKKELHPTGGSLSTEKSSRKEFNKRVGWGCEEVRGPSSAWSSGWESLHLDSELAWRLDITQEKHKKLGGKVSSSLAAISGEDGAFVC